MTRYKFILNQCNGSDVFGSDICTCRPYLIYGISECVRAAQTGGVGLIVYFRKEGRALGEVTKYLVYNARKRAEGGDTAAAYFKRTENVAGVKVSFWAENRTCASKLRCQMFCIGLVSQRLIA